MKCKLTKIQSSHNNLRSGVIEGIVIQMPTIGGCLVMHAKALVPWGLGPEPTGYTRQITTSEVTSIEREGTEILFTTLNSTYLLELFDEVAEAVL